jgi:hypothetical protein
MIKAVIKNLQNDVTHAGTFATQELAESWVSQVSQTGAFGKVLRWLTEQETVREGKAINQALSSQTDVAGVTTYQFPAEFTIQYLDVSQDINTEMELSYRQMSRQVGMRLFDKVASLTESKQISFATLAGIQVYAMTMESLKNGWLMDARVLITSMDETYYTVQEKTALTDEITAFLQAQGKE